MDFVGGNAPHAAPGTVSSHANLIQRPLFVIGELGPGGAERQLVYLAVELRSRGFAPTVAVWNATVNPCYERDLREAGVDVVFLPRAGGAAGRTLAAARLVRRLTPAIVHSYSFHTNFFTWLATRRSGTPVVGSLRNNYLADRAAGGRVGGALCARLPGTLIANSGAAARAATEDARWSAPRDVRVVPNGVSLPPAERYSCWPTGPLEILGVGRLHPQKAWLTAIDALEQLRAARPEGWRFRLCGDGSERPALERRVEALGLSGHVEFLGLRDDVARLLSTCHVLVLTSRWEGCPNVVLEAMAAARVVIASKVGDLSAIVDEGKTGYLIDIDDSRGLARTLSIALDRIRDLRAVGLNARRQVEQSHSIALLADRSLAVYADLIARTRPQHNRRHNL